MKRERKKKEEEGGRHRFYDRLIDEGREGGMKGGRKEGRKKELKKMIDNADIFIPQGTDAVSGKICIVPYSILEKMVDNGKLRPEQVTDRQATLHYCLLTLP